MAADNVAVTAGSGTSIRTFSDGTNEWQVAIPAYVTGGSAGAWTMQQVDATHGLPAAQQGTWTVQPGNTANTTPWLMSPTPATSGGASPYSYLSAGSANQDSQSVKGSAGQLYGYQVYNTTASARYVKVYDKATAPTSADTPVMRIYVPPSGGAAPPLPVGVAFSSGIGIRVTTGVADNDTGAASANDVIVNLDYK